VKAYSQTERRYIKERRGETGLPEKGNWITTIKQEVWACGDIWENGKNSDQKIWIRIIKRSLHAERQNM
jgi:hypothetical protein